MTHPQEDLATRPLNFWENKFWHHKVHERLGETLYYYLVRVRPFDESQINERMGKLLSTLRLGSVRVFPIFGQWDILIRAWLHPTAVNSFQTELNLQLADTIRAHHTFAVSTIIRRWYDRGQRVDKSLLANLNESTIRGVQSGQNISLLNDLIEGQVVQVRAKQAENAINFFVAINLEAGTSAIYDDVVDALHNHWIRVAQIHNASIYRGYGFSQILFKGQVQDYLRIAEFTNGMIKQFKSVGMNTETFLLHGSSHIIGNEGIGEATFLGLKGVNLFVQSIIPELYTEDFPRRHLVERFVDEEAREKEFTKEDRKLIRDYLLGFLNDDATQMASTLYTFFAGLEKYLRLNHGKFIGLRTKKSTRDIYKAAGLESSKKHLALGDLLKVYSVAIEDADPNDKELSGNWDDLANVRNQVAHGDEDFEKKWKEHLKVLFVQLPRLHKLTSTIEAELKTDEEVA
jgi:hypothetical protein